MDITTILGIVLGLILTFYGISAGGGAIGDFYDLASIYITLGGTLAATLITYPVGQIKEAMKVATKAFVNKPVHPGEIIAKIIGLANVARKEGLLALEEASGELDDEFLKKGIMLIVDGTDPELVRNLLETELSFIEERHSNGAGIFDTMGAYAPAFGMFGTLIGLVLMLKNLNDPSTIGSSMAVALVTTVYGTFLANLAFLPMAAKLKIRSREEIQRKEIMVEGLLSIQAGENPRIIEEKLKAFLPPKLRGELANSKEGVGMNG